MRFIHILCMQFAATVHALFEQNVYAERLNVFPKERGVHGQLSRNPVRSVVSERCFLKCISFVY